MASSTYAAGLILAGALLSSPAPLLAQSAPSSPNGTCGAGTIPGPGGGCMYIPQGGGQAPQIPAYRDTAWTDNYTSFAWFTNKQGKADYVYSTYNIYPNIADDFAMQRCRQTGASDCEIGPRYTNAYIAVARSAEGKVNTGYGNKSKEAKEAALAFCATRGNKCKVEKLVNGSAWKYYTN
ncbi:DUF4189 domain-containing protein [Sphingomonas sp.]|uniref:DUF4189 domain-containing protein n=1 Tax=Sphingomonas sp. TaxID=28214 RepID=UPI003D6C889D